MDISKTLPSIPLSKARSLAFALSKPLLAWPRASAATRRFSIATRTTSVRILRFEASTRNHFLLLDTNRLMYSLVDIPRGWFRCVPDSLPFFPDPPPPPFLLLRPAFYEKCGFTHKEYEMVSNIGMYAWFPCHVALALNPLDVLISFSLPVFRSSTPRSPLTAPVRCRTSRRF